MSIEIVWVLIPRPLGVGLADLGVDSADLGVGSEDPGVVSADAGVEVAELDAPIRAGIWCSCEPTGWVREGEAIAWSTMSRSDVVKGGVADAADSPKQLTQNLSGGRV